MTYHQKADGGNRIDSHTSRTLRFRSLPAFKRELEPAQKRDRFAVSICTFLKAALKF